MNVGDEFAKKTATMLERNSPLSMASALHLIRMARNGTLTDAFTNEYRFTHRALEFSDLLEGIRAQIIDKDRSPRWKNTIQQLTEEDVHKMVAPLPKGDWKPEGN